jgi:hypothetical protein
MHCQANPLVYFDIALGRYGDAVPLGRIVMELKEDVVPKTTGAGHGCSCLHLLRV